MVDYYPLETYGPNNPNSFLTEGANTEYTIHTDYSGIVFPVNFSVVSVPSQPLHISKPITQVARVIQDRFREKYQALLTELREHETLTNPISGMAEIIKEIALDDDAWREIIEEPYG